MAVLFNTLHGQETSERHPDLWWHFSLARFLLRFHRLHLLQSVLFALGNLLLTAAVLVYYYY